MEFWFKGQPFDGNTLSGNMDNWFRGLPENTNNTVVDVRSIKLVDVTIMSLVKSTEGDVLLNEIKFYNGVPNQ